VSDGSPAAQLDAGGSTSQAGILVDVAGDLSADKPVTRPTTQPPVDIDAATAIPEDTFAKCV